MSKKKIRKPLSFMREVYRASCLPDVLCGIAILLYASFIVNIDVRQHWLFFITVSVLIFAAQFVLAPITNIFLTKDINARMKKWKKQGLTKEERTQLFLKLHRFPRIKQTEAFLYFFFCAILFAGSYHFVIGVTVVVNICSFFSTILGAYVASILALSYSRSICTKYECALVDEGLNPEIYEAKKIYGISYDTCYIFYCVIPVVWSMLLFLAMFAVYYFNNVATPNGYVYGETHGIVLNQISKFAGILILSFIMGSISIYSFLKSILVSSQRLQNSMTHILQNDIFSVKLNSTDYENEFTYNIGLVNNVVMVFRSILHDIQGIGKTMVNPIEQLSQISQNTATTSLEQSSGVKEILATMEETDTHTKEILNRVSEVTNVAEITSVMVDSGSENLQQNLYKMDEITEANLSTINGIRDLSEKIGSVWEIVKIINNIADQTRIIAFNAELEASSAGESGKNFHIVANEVRRLAAGITSSVEKIKDRITEIQHSSDNLIITSESGTEKIREGQRLFEKLDERFGEIRKSSDFTVESAKQIKEYIFQQSAAFDQIVSTVRQISAGIENFSSATNTVNQTAIKLKIAADRLENLHNGIISSELG